MCVLGSKVVDLALFPIYTHRFAQTHEIECVCLCLRMHVWVNLNVSICVGVNDCTWWRMYDKRML